MKMSGKHGSWFEAVKVVSPLRRLRPVPVVLAGLRGPGMGRRRMRDDAPLLRRPGGAHGEPCRMRSRLRSPPNTLSGRSPSSGSTVLNAFQSPLMRILSEAEQS